MADNTTIAPGQPYSARNKVPNVQEFLHRLDRDKKHRDAAIDEELKKSKVANGDAKPHVEQHVKRKNTKMVRDPVTGADVEIEDANMNFKDIVDNPKVGTYRLYCMA